MTGNSQALTWRMSVMTFQRALFFLQFEATYCHWGYSQNLTKNQDWLKCSITSSEALSSCSPHNPPSSSAMQLFPSECIFHRRHELKLLEHTDGSINFPIFKDKNRALKEPTWKQIEPWAQELRLHCLHLLVQGEDLPTWKQIEPWAQELGLHMSTSLGAMWGPIYKRGHFPPVLSQIIQT